MGTPRGCYRGRYLARMGLLENRFGASSPGTCALPAAKPKALFLAAGNGLARISTQILRRLEDLPMRRIQDKKK